jgi:hypothetical protein
MVCDWTPMFSNCGEDGSCTHLDSMPADLSDVAQEAAVTWLWEATLRRYGNCPVTILPCTQRCSTYGSSPPWVPYRSTTGGWVNVGCNRCAVDDCSCTRVDQIILPTAGTVIDVEIEGEVLSEEAWRLYNSRILARIDGGSWPTCQDLAYETTPTFAVTFTPGTEVPAMGLLAAGSLSCQLARRLCGQSCELPSNATSISRQGVSILLEPGVATGIWLIDQWVEMMNKAMSKVWSPGLRGPLVASSVPTSP